MEYLLLKATDLSLSLFVVTNFVPSHTKPLSLSFTETPTHRHTAACTLSELLSFASLFPLGGVATTSVSFISFSPLLIVVVVVVP